VRYFLGVLSHGALVTLPAVAVEALWKEWDDALGATKDTQREVLEERLVVVTAENVHDAAQAEASCLRMELKGMGRSLSLLLPADADLWAALLGFRFDAPCPYRCRVEGGGLSLDGAALWDLGGGR
jgi:hypothetical protein